jgi:membrane-associated phospholipid phosphatase
MKRRVAIVLFVVAFAIACFVDAPVADAVRQSGLAGKVRGSDWAEAVKFFGTFWYAVVMAGGLRIIGRWFGETADRPIAPSRVDHGLDPSAKTQAAAKAFLDDEQTSTRPAHSRWRGPVSVIAAAALSGLNVVPKWIVGQARPFKPDGTTVAQPFVLHWFSNGLPGLFHEQDLAFPSGHACMSAAIAAAVAFARPKLFWVVVPIALIVGIERVIENAHYVDDVIAGWAFGWLAAVASRKLVLDGIDKTGSNQPS